MIARMRRNGLSPLAVVMHLALVPFFIFVGIAAIPQGGSAAPIGLLFVFGAPLLMFGFFSFSRLVWLEYSFHRHTWYTDGRPTGYFWRAPECNWFESGMTMQRLMFAWLFTAPEWAARTDGAATWLTRYRFCVLAWNVMALAAVAYEFLGPLQAAR